MGFQLNANAARKGDSMSTVIRDSGAYVGVITRAEKLVSQKGTQGIGLSFRADDGANANYLDLWTVNAAGNELRGYDIVQAILVCLRLKTVDDGKISFEKWDRDAGGLVKVEADGYPVLMGKRIGLVLQQELQTHSVTGADVERINLISAFDPESRLTSSEILDGKTKGERLAKLEASLARKPVRDTRKRKDAAPQVATGGAQSSAEFPDDIPF